MKLVTATYDDDALEFVPLVPDLAADPLPREIEDAKVS